MYVRYTPDLNTILIKNKDILIVIFYFDILENNMRQIKVNGLLLQLSFLLHHGTKLTLSFSIKLWFSQSERNINGYSWIHIQKFN